MNLTTKNKQISVKSTDLVRLKKNILRKLKIVKIVPTYYRISELIILTKEFNPNYNVKWNSTYLLKKELDIFCKSIVNLIKETDLTKIEDEDEDKNNKIDEKII